MLLSQFDFRYYRHYCSNYYITNIILIIFYIIITMLLDFDFIPTNLHCDGYCIFVPRLHYPGKTGRISDDSTVPPKLYIFSVTSYILLIALKAHITSQV